MHTSKYLDQVLKDDTWSHPRLSNAEPKEELEEKLEEISSAES